MTPGVSQRAVGNGTRHIETVTSSASSGALILQLDDQQCRPDEGLEPMAIAVAAPFSHFFLSYLITPLVRDVAIRHDFVDRPDSRRKMQTSAVALGGGAVLLIVTLSVVLLAGVWWGWDLWMMAQRPSSVLGLCGAAVLLVTVGLIDDAVGIRGSYKLFWQVVAASLVMGAGLSVPRLGFLNFVVSTRSVGPLVHHCLVAWRRLTRSI